MKENGRRMVAVSMVAVRHTVVIEGYHTVVLEG